jgi:enterobactin synthetase component D
LALAERARRQIEIVGGRLAFRAAAREVGCHADDWALTAGEDRAPRSPPGWTVSLTHKDDLAVAVIGAESFGLLGIDLEGGSRDRSAIMSRVCRPEELLEVQALPEPERWPNVMVRFAVKEAVYKAVAPQLRRFIGFDAARVDVLTKTEVRVTLFLGATDPVFAIETELLWLDQTHVVTLVRAKTS